MAFAFLVSLQYIFEIFISWIRERFWIFDSEDWLTGSSKLISFWSSGESVEGSNVGCLGGSITRETKEGHSDKESNS